MPGFELWNDEERKEVNDVLETGILMRYGFDAPRKGIWKQKTRESLILCARSKTYFSWVIQRYESLRSSQVEEPRSKLNVGPAIFPSCWLLSIIEVRINNGYIAN